MDNLDKLKRIITSVIDIDEKEIKTGSNFKEDLGAEPLDLVEIVMEIEEEFDIQIPDEDVGKITTIDEALKYIEDVAE